MSDALVTWLIVCAFGVVITIGFGSGRASVKEDCDNFGAVVISDVKYECRKVTT